jgi:hypothetical protein
VGSGADLGGSGRYELTSGLQTKLEKKKQMKTIKMQDVIFEEMVTECRFIAEDPVSCVGAREAA